jgi:CHAT domain-containing protein
MCVRSDTTQWRATKEPGERILERNLDLRRVLTDYSDEAVLHFDVASARYLYDELLAPLAQCIGNRAVIIAPAPDLLTVPFAALLTDDPAPGTTFKQWPWLIRSHSISIVPSPSSFVYLRKNAGVPARQAAFVGFGNPVFTNATAPARSTHNAILYRGSNTAEIRLLPPLPDTEDELKAVVKVFGPDHSRLFLGRSATKKMLHSLKLEDYRFIEFATHGLVAGDFTQLLEPAIALTPEDTSDPENDGLLTTSEIRTLILKADLVVLSACNTAAPDGAPNAKGLSGLANAFFEAGAHSLLVSQWSVYSSAAAAIIPETLRNLERDQSAGSAEALRRAMLAFLDDARRPELAHPRAWAAFTVAGDGRPATRH